MKNKLEFKGYFWTPENPEQKITGLFKFDDKNGVELELFGQLKVFDDINSKDEVTLLGFTSNGKKITLLNCYEIESSFGAPGFSTSSISSIYFLLGEHFESKSKVEFDSMNIVYEDINYWLYVSGFDRMQYDEQKNETIIKYTKPENLTYTINNDWRLDIDFSVWSPMANSRPFERAEINQVPEVILRPNQKKGFNEFQEYFQTLNSFLAICYFTYPKIKSIEYYLKKDIEKEEQETIKVELFFKRGVNYSNYRKHNHKRRFLLTYLNFDGQFQDVIKKWFSLKEKIDASINILTESFMNREGSTEFYFLGFAQALENMHRRLNGKKKQTLLKRFNSIISNMPNEIQEELLSNEVEFSKRLTLNRNHFTHLDDKPEGKVASLSELFMLSEKMKIILLTSILKELGLDESIIKKVILENGMWLFNHIIKIKDAQPIEKNQLIDG